MATKSTKKNVKVDSDSEYTGWRVAAMVVDGIFGLFNSNKVYPAFGVIILILVGLVLWRLPETELANLLREFLSLLGQSWGVVFATLILTNATWFLLFRKMRALYQQEIDRLAAIRKELMHDGLKTIAGHRSSNEAENATYILPAKTES